MKTADGGAGLFRIAVIGGGASGLVAAVSAAQEAQKLNKHVDITVFEANQRVGKKLLVTGNGRCNLTNRNISSANYRGSTGLFEKVYMRFDNEDTLAFFTELGLYTKTDQAGRVYPLSNQASSVLDCLRDALEKYTIHIVSETAIASLTKGKNGFLLNGKFSADAVIVAAGGKAAPIHGSNGSGYKLLENFGVRCTPLFPALTALNIKNFTKSLKGIRAEGRLSVLFNGKILASSSGELQFTDYGISGIPAMQVSRFAAVNAGKNGRLTVITDCAPELPFEKLADILETAKRFSPDKTMENVLAGIMPKRLGAYLLTLCSVSPAMKAGVADKGTLDRIISAIKKSEFEITSVRGFSEAQVTAGGIKEEEIDPHTLMLKKAEKVYICGEIADIDGECGGYNLQWAFSSGAIAGKSVIRGIK